jgi:hypothetical protein
MSILIELALRFALQGLVLAAVSGVTNTASSTT